MAAGLLANDARLTRSNPPRRSSRAIQGESRDVFTSKTSKVHVPRKSTLHRYQKNYITLNCFFLNIEVT